MLELSCAVSSGEYHTQIGLRTRLVLPHSDYVLRELMSEIQAMLCNPESAFSGTEVAGGSTCIRLLQAAAKPLVCSALALEYIISLCPRPNFFPHTYLVGVTVIKKTVDLSGQPALHSAALG